MSQLIRGAAKTLFGRIPRASGGHDDAETGGLAILYGWITLIGLIAAVVATGFWFRRRRCRRIREMAEVRGWKVVALKFTATPSLRDVVEYVGPQGELRQAAVLQHTMDLVEDRPYQCVLKEKYERSKAHPMLATLKLAAECGKLPGREEYVSVMRELSSGAKDAVTVEETTGVDAGRPRFAPLVQCLEAAGIGSTGDRGDVVEFVVDGKDLNVRWRVEGASPNRRLRIEVVRG